MPKVSVYLPDELYRRARSAELPLSALTQAAVEEALAARSTDAWIDEVARRPVRYRRRVDTSAVIDAARDEFGT